MVEIPTDKLLDRKEVAEILQISYDSVKYKGAGTGCLVEIRYTRKVLFNPHQVLMHRQIIWSGEECDGRCKEALKPKISPEDQRLFRRKKRTD
jgi:hypothetical protein